jgi:hypothetical protein
MPDQVSLPEQEQDELLQQGPGKALIGPLKGERQPESYGEA